jgi:hypothetical protein
MSLRWPRTCAMLVMTASSTQGRKCVSTWKQGEGEDGLEEGGGWEEENGDG